MGSQSKGIDANVISTTGIRGAVSARPTRHLWWIPNGETPDRIREHELLQGVDVPNTGYLGNATALVTASLLMYAEGRGGRPIFYAHDKRTGERIGQVEMPAPASVAPMTYLHDGRQYIIVPVSGQGMPSGFVALALPR